MYQTYRNTIDIILKHYSENIIFSVDSVVVYTDSCLNYD